MRSARSVWLLVVVIGGGWCWLLFVACSWSWLDLFVAIDAGCVLLLWIVFVVCGCVVCCCAVRVLWFCVVSVRRLVLLLCVVCC